MKNCSVGLRYIVVGLGLFFSNAVLAAGASVTPFQTVPLDYGTTPLASIAASGVNYNVEQSWISMINAATTRLDIEMMYLADDTVTPTPSSCDPAYQAIVSAAGRGVDVRLRDDGLRVDDCSVGSSLVAMFEKDWSLGTVVPGGTTYNVHALPACTITGTSGLSVALSPNYSTYNRRTSRTRSTRLRD